MNEKSFFSVLLASLFLFSLSGCCTRGGIHGNRDGAYTVRENLTDLIDKQTETAVTGTALAGTVEHSAQQSAALTSDLTASRSTSAALEKSITDGKDSLDRLAAILQHIRARNSSGTGSKADRN